MEDPRRNIQISDYQGETFPFDPSESEGFGERV